MDQGQKRILSPENTQLTPDKRIRHQSVGLGSTETLVSATGPEVFTMADIMAELRHLRVKAITKEDLSVFVTKEELKTVVDKQTAQAEEMGSLSRNVHHPLRRCNVRYQAFLIKM